MMYSNLTTDELIDFIVNKIGTPIPKYNYDFHRFETVIPTNIKSESTIVGIEDEMLHNNFRDACYRIIMWWDEFNCEHS